MSFILDALRKAETLRTQTPQVRTAEGQFAELAEPAVETVIKPVWIAVALASVVAVAAIAWSFGRTTSEPISVPVVATATETALMLPLPDNANEREIRPLDSEVKRGAPTPVAVTAAKPGAAPVPVTPGAAPGRVKPGTVEVSLTPLSRDNGVGNTPAPIEMTNITGDEQLPSYQTLALSGRTSLPPFHLDIHVYSQQPERRFVFVNNRKYREGEQLEEGGSVERITAEGVVLNHRGHRFELLPD